MNAPIYTFVLLERDFVEALRLHSNYRPWPRRVSNFIFYGSTAAAAACFCYFVLLISRYGNEAGFQHGFGLVLSFSLMILLPMAASRRRSDLFDKTMPPALRNLNRTIQFDEDAFVYATSGHSESRLSWRAVSNYLENQEIALLYIGPEQFIYIPKRIMDEAEWERLRELALSHKVKGE